MQPNNKKLKFSVAFFSKTGNLTIQIINQDIKNIEDIKNIG